MAVVAGRIRKWRSRSGAAGWAAMGLSSCAYLAGESQTPPPAAEAPPEPQVAVVGPRTPPRPSHKPSPPAVQPPTDTPPAAASENVDPDRVIGLEESDAANWLGEPSARSDAPPATIWRYLSKDCQIDVYFYLDLQRGVMRVLHYEVRSVDSVERRPERCFQQLVGERQQRNSATTSYPPR